MLKIVSKEKHHIINSITLMNKEKTIEQRLHTYAISQDDSLDRHMPKPKNLFWIALASPLIALTAWLWLIILACKES